MWRTGRKVGRTIYRQLGPEPADSDPLVGVMDTPELAAEAVATRNFVASCPDGCVVVPVGALPPPDDAAARMGFRAPSTASVPRK